MNHFWHQSSISQFKDIRKGSFEASLTSTVSVLSIRTSLMLSAQWTMWDWLIHHIPSRKLTYPAWESSKIIFESAKRVCIWYVSCQEGTVCECSHAQHKIEPLKHGPPSRCFFVVRSSCNWSQSTISCELGDVNPSCQDDISETGFLQKWRCNYQSHMLHGTGIFTYIWLKNSP